MILAQTIDFRHKIFQIVILRTSNEQNVVAGRRVAAAAAPPPRRAASVGPNHFILISERNKKY